LRATALLISAASLLSGTPSFGATSVEDAAPEQWSAHFQATLVPQFHGPFDAAYSGPNSLSNAFESNTSLTSTLFLSGRLWKGAEGYLNPEISAGSGFSGTHGMAGFPNGEIYRVDSPTPKPNLSRLFIQQRFGLGGESESFEDDKNQLAGRADQARITVVAGKFSLNDYFDGNAYSHDPRTQFLNWSLMDNAAWDYAADTRGYTWGFMIELNEPRWAIRFSSVLEPYEANQLDFDTDVAQAHGDNLELEVRYALSAQPGKARLLAYANHARMGSYAEALALSPVAPDVTQTRDYRTKYGLGLNLEQAVNEDLGLFARLGWNDGATESWAFTEVDQTASLGAAMKGVPWSRPGDTVGGAAIVNGLSHDHAAYLAAGGVGFIIGDGALTYAPEEILEVYYSFLVIKGGTISADYQWVDHPAYNQDRGPASIFAGRLHYEF
jgi:high affinity Mn2+ porin